MQGHTACQVKPGLFRLDPSQFPGVTAAFPEGGGAIIFIFLSRENLVKYTSPDGRADEDSIDGEDIQIDPPGWDPAKSHGEGWEWRGRLGSQPGDKDGSWYNPETGQSLHPDLDHPEGVKPHWDYKPGRDKEKIRINPDTGRPLTNDDTLKNAARAGFVIGGSITTYFIAKKVIGTIIVFILEPITTGIGVGLLVTP